MEEGLFTPIGEVILKENENLCLVFGMSGLKQVDLFFFRVFRLYTIHRTYTLPEIAAGGTVDFNYLGEDDMGAGTNILAVYERFPFRILHYGIGINPEGEEIWMYKAQPPDVEATGFGYEVEAPKLGDKRDYISGKISPYSRPSRSTEGIVFNKFTVHYGFYNSSTSAITPNLRILGAGYDCLPITSEKFQNAILVGRKPCRILTAGSLRTFTYSVPTDWLPAKRRVGIEEIEGLMK